MTRMLRLLAATAATLVAAAAMAAGAWASHSIHDHMSVGPSGGNGAFDAFYDATSADGTRMVFDTDERLVPADTDGSYDLYERHGGTTTLLSIGPAGGNGAFDIFFAAVSDDGTRVFFETDERLTAADTDNAFDVYERSGGTTTLVSTGATGGNGPADVTFHGISRDGSRVFFETTEQLVSADTDSESDIYERSAGTTKLVSTGPAGGNGPFFVAFGGASDDGSRVFFETDEQLVAGDTDSFYDVYERSGGTTTLVSTGPAGGNGSVDAGYRANSADGTRVFFHTPEALVGADTDAQIDVYARSGGTTTLLSTGPAGGNGALPATFEGSSADGTTVFISTNEQLTTADTDARRDIYRRDGAGTALVSTGPAGGNGAFDADFMGASLDGSHAYIRTEEALVAADTDTGCAAGQGPQCRDVYEHAGGVTTLVSTGPTGGNGAFDASFAAVSLDGSRVFFDTRESLVAGDTDTSADVYERFNGTTTLISTGPAGGNGAFSAFLFPDGLSDDGTRAFFDTRESLTASDTDTAFDIYVAGVAGYPRPRHATPIRASLALAYEPCTAPNRTHAAPLSYDSCHPPTASSAQATVGTPDALGGASNFVGSVRYAVAAGDLGPPEDSDVVIVSSLTDVRCRPTGASCGAANSAGPADYTGELRVAVELRMTDRWNAAAPGGGTDPATVEDVTLERSFPCGPTGSTSIGSRCALTTTANAIVPGLVKDTKRAIWETGQVRVFDGGPDGDADTPAGDTLFAVQGIFIP